MTTDDAIDTVASVLAQAFTLYEKSVGDAKVAFKKTLADDNDMQFVVFPLDVMVAKQELNVMPPYTARPISSGLSSGLF